MASHCEKIDPMPSKHRYRAITPRPPDDLRERFQQAAADLGTNMNALLITFMRWCVHETDDPPPRAPRDRS